MSHQQDQHPSNPVETANADEMHELACHLQRSIRYHRARERFFDSGSNAVSFVSLISGSAVVISVLAASPSWVALSTGATVAVAQTIEQVARLSVKARLHNSLAGEFLALERIVTLRGELTVDELKEIKAEVLTIETREPPIKRYLDLICHNQVARAMGSTDVETLTRGQRWFAQWLDGDAALNS